MRHRGMDVVVTSLKGNTLGIKNKCSKGTTTTDRCNRVVEKPYIAEGRKESLANSRRLIKQVGKRKKRERVGQSVQRREREERSLGRPNVGQANKVGWR